MMKNLLITIAIVFYFAIVNGEYGDFEEIPQSNYLAAIKEIGEGVFDGDMRLTKAQMEIIRQLIRHKRTAGRDVLKWDMPLPYSLHSSLRKSAKKAVHSAIKVIEKESCVRFEKVGVNSEKPHLEIFRGTGNWSGCYSMGVGRVPILQIVFMSQFLSLGDGCDTKAIAIHELLHALGFVHEQSRFDRDNFIDVNFDNIIEDTASNFEVQSIRDVACYDFGSIMQYSEKAFTQNTRRTLVANDKHFQNTMRTSTRGSFIDWFSLNELYCNESCNKKFECQNGGYINPNDCNRCKCVEGFGGDDCSRIVATKTYEAKSKWSKPQSILMWPSEKKILYFKTKPGKKIQLKLKKNDAECFEEFHSCAQQFVEIKLGNPCLNQTDLIPNFRRTGYRLCKCSENDPNFIFDSASNSAFIVAKNREKNDSSSSQIHQFEFEFQYRRV